MNRSKSNERILHHDNVRLCRLRPWSNYNGLGFHTIECFRSPHMVCLVESNSPAAAGGLKIWDVILAINNENVSDTDDTQVKMILETTLKDTRHHLIELLVVCQDFYQILKKNNIKINSSMANVLTTPIKMPEEYINFPKYVSRTCHIRLQSNDSSFGFDAVDGNNSIGVYVQDVILNSPAYKAGLRKSDRIIKIDNKYVDKKSSRAIYEKLNKALIKRNITLFVMDTETYRISMSNDSAINKDAISQVDHVTSREQSVISLASSDNNNNSESSISSESNVLKSPVFNHEHFLLQNTQRSNVMNTPKVATRAKVKTFHSKNELLNQNKSSILSGQHHSNCEHNNEYENPDDNHISTPEITLGQNDHYEYLDASKNVIDDDKHYKASQRFFDVQNEPLALFLPIEGYDDIPLLSLNNAVENLAKIIPNIRRNAWIALQRSVNPIDGLTSDESAAIQLYTMEWNPNDQSLFMKLNYALRMEDRNRLTPYFPYLKLILTALWKLKSLQTIVWRGVKADLRMQYPIGKVFVWWGFSSCVESQDLLESDEYLGNKGVRTLFHIECKTGKSIHFHAYSKRDNEILLLPGTQFQVMNHDVSTDNLFIIYLKEIQPKYTFLQPPFDADYSLISLETNRDISEEELNQYLQKFIDNHKMESSICFSEQSLTVDDMYLITNELHSNKCWNKISFQQTHLKETHINSLMYALQSNWIIVSLDLKSNQLNDDNASIIALALKKNTSLENVDLTNNQITEIGAQSFADMLMINETLLSLNLSSNTIGDDGIISIFRALQYNKTLKSLHLNQTKLTHKGVQELAINLQLKTNLMALYLNENNLGDEGVIGISRFLIQNTQLNTIHLAMNNITFVGAEQIALVLQQTISSLTELNLSKNPLQDVGIISIAQALIKNTTLIELYLDSVEMTINGLQEIIKMIRINETLKYLSLKKNDINDDGMFLFLDGLKTNHVLTHVYLNDNQLTDQCISDIVNMLNNNQTFKCLYLSDTPVTIRKKSSFSNKITVRQVIDDVWF